MDEPKKANKRLRRHLDHLQDITAGRHWTPLPEPLRTLWFDGRISDTKVKLIMIMISHAADFHIRNDYLRHRFSPASLRMMIPELIEDGIIRKDKIRIGSSTVTIFHTNPIDEWDLREAKPDFTRSPVNGSPVNGSPVNGSRVNGLNKNKGNQKKGNETKSNRSRSDGSQDDAKRPPLKEAKASAGDTGKAEQLPKAQLIALRQSIEWIFKKSPKGGYTFATAENAIREFIQRRGLVRASEVITWLCEMAEEHSVSRANSWFVNEPNLRKCFDAADAVMCEKAKGAGAVDWRPGCNWDAMEAEARERAQRLGSLDDIPY